MIEGLERDAEEMRRAEDEEPSESGSASESYASSRATRSSNDALLDFDSSSIASHSVRSGGIDSTPVPANYREMLGMPDREPETHEEEQQYLSALGFDVRVID